MQHIADTGSKPNPNHADIMPMISAMPPAIGELVASIIAGNVITESVTYGT